MTGCSRSFDLHAAALIGDDEGVLGAINAGADINALDSAGRTAIMCAVAGENWRDVDALNGASFMTRGRLNAIKRILRHPDISLYTMNAPQSSLNGVTPLGMAAWLDAHDVVKMLLEESADAVAVDGMDDHGATALMYAARDGRLEVVRILLSHGARPDFRDCNHRTSVQYALQHPQILWLCELVLRSHRWRECQVQDRSRLFQHSESHLLDVFHSPLPSLLSSYSTGNPARQLTYPPLSPPPPTIFDPKNLPRATRTIISCIESEDLAFLYSLLFSPLIPHDSPATRHPRSVPLLINQPDEETGWSPIHYCAGSERLNVHILDALYCAGADVALFTRDEEITALHILAMLARLPDSRTGTDVNETYQIRLTELRDFTIHLISDLRAPLGARDKNDETCIHVAAEHGTCVELLTIFLECDTTGAVREMRNSRGLRPVDVAKPEFREAFGQKDEDMRCVSSLSMRTIRPVESFASLASLKDWGSDGARYSYSSSDTPPFVSQFDTATAEKINSPQARPYSTDSELIGGELELDGLVLKIMENLNNTSACLQQTRFRTATEKTNMLRVIDATTILSGHAMNKFRSHLDDVSRALQELTVAKDKVNGLWGSVDRLAGEKSKELRLKRVLRRRRTLRLDDSVEQRWIFEGERERGSEDSQTTAVSHFLCPPIVVFEAQSLVPTKKPSMFRSPSLLSLISQKLERSSTRSSTPSSPLLSSVPSTLRNGPLSSPVSTTWSQDVSSAERDAVANTRMVGTQTLLSDIALGGSITDGDMEGIRVLLSLDNSHLSSAAVAAAATQILSCWPEHLDGFFLSVDSATYYNAHLANLMKIEQALLHKAKDGIDPKIRQMIKKKRKLLQEKIKEMQGNHSNAHFGKDTKESRVKAWFKRMVGSSGDSVGHGMQREGNMMLAGSATPVKIVYDIDEDCNVAREARFDEKVHSEALDANNVLFDEVHETNDVAVEAALRTSKIIMEAAVRDMHIVERYLKNAEEFRSLANQAATRAERIIGQALKRRKMMLTESSPSRDADLLASNIPGTQALKPISEEDDDDLRIIRRLIFRKIEALTSDAWDELEKIVSWLRIIKEVIRGVKRRAYL